MLSLSMSIQDLNISGEQASIMEQHQGAIFALEEKLNESERANASQAAELDKAQRTIADLQAKIECISTSSTEAS